MDRLTWHINKSVGPVPTKINFDFIFPLDKDTSNGIMNILDKLADYEDAEEQGKLVFLPNVKHGDTVFVLGRWKYWKLRNKILEYKVTGIHYVGDVNVKGFTWQIDVGDVEDDLYSEWFLTREEAENALKNVVENL